MKKNHLQNQLYRNFELNLFRTPSKSRKITNYLCRNYFYFQEQAKKLRSVKNKLDKSDHCRRQFESSSEQLSQAPAGNKRSHYPRSDAVAQNLKINLNDVFVLLDLGLLQAGSTRENKIPKMPLKKYRQEKGSQNKVAMPWVKRNRSLLDRAKNVKSSLNEFSFRFSNNVTKKGKKVSNETQKLNIVESLLMTEEEEHREADTKLSLDKLQTLIRNFLLDSEPENLKSYFHFLEKYLDLKSSSNRDEKQRLQLKYRVDDHRLRLHFILKSFKSIENLKYFLVFLKKEQFMFKGYHRFLKAFFHVVQKTKRLNLSQQNTVANKFVNLKLLFRLASELQALIRSPKAICGFMSDLQSKFRRFFASFLNVLKSILNTLGVSDKGDLTVYVERALKSVCQFFKELSKENRKRLDMKFFLPYLRKLKNIIYFVNVNSNESELKEKYRKYFLYNYK